MVHGVNIPDKKDNIFIRIIKKLKKISKRR